MASFGSSVASDHWPSGPVCFLVPSAAPPLSPGLFLPPALPMPGPCHLSQSAQLLLSPFLPLFLLCTLLHVPWVTFLSDISDEAS